LALTPALSQRARESDLKIAFTPSLRARESDLKIAFTPA
jgi:hypothetical protein